MPKPDDRRATIRNKAAELFARKGVASTTVREIGDAVGILSGSLYHHFPSKDAIVEEIVHEFVHDLLERCERVRSLHTDPTRCLEALIEESFDSLRTNPEACEIYQNDYRYLVTIPALGDIESLVAQIQKMWTETIREGIAEGAFRKDLDPTVCYRFLRDSIWPTVRWYRTGKQYKIDVIAATCTTLFLHGFEAAPSGSRRPARKVAARAR